MGPLSIDFYYHCELNSYMRYSPGKNDIFYLISCLVLHSFKSAYFLAN